MEACSIPTRNSPEQGSNVELNYLVAKSWKSLRLACRTPLGNGHLSSESKRYGIMQSHNFLQVNARNMVLMSLLSDKGIHMEQRLGYFC